MRSAEEWAPIIFNYMQKHPVKSGEEIIPQIIAIVEMVQEDCGVVLVDPANDRGLRSLGIGYFISSEQGPQFAALNSNPKLRRLAPDDSYYKVFAVIDPHPPYGVEDAAADVARVLWEPEHRSFTVKAAAAGKFYLSEQWNPGWSALIDGQPTRIERGNNAFQAIKIPAGQHRIDFAFKDEGLRMGAAISLATILLMVAALRKSSAASSSR